jgi:hypothetical protein
MKKLPLFAVILIAGVLIVGSVAGARISNPIGLHPANNLSDVASSSASLSNLMNPTGTRFAVGTTTFLNNASTTIEVGLGDIRLVNGRLNFSSSAGNTLDYIYSPVTTGNITLEARNLITIDADGDSNSSETVGIAFQTRDSTKMFLSNSGLLGIGTSTPSELLDVFSATGDPSLTVRASTTNGASQEARLNLFSGDDFTRLFFRDSAGDFGIFNQGATRMRIDGPDMKLMEGSGTNAQISIGTTTLGYPLWVNQTASTTVAIGSTNSIACLIMGDSDGVGVTYVSANDGVLSATAVKPAFCK